MYKRRIVFINVCTLYRLSTFDRIFWTCTCNPKKISLVPVIQKDIYPYI